MRRATVLLIEDDLSLGRTAAELLRCFGYGVVWRATLEGALRSLHEVPHDVVLLDLKLRGEYGPDLLHGSTGTRIPPIVIVSAQPMEECQTVAQQVGAQAVLHKPYDSADLLHAVRVALGEAA